MHYVYSVNFPIQVLKNHLRLIRGSTILDHTGTRFLGGRLIRGSDLYASIYGSLYRLNIESDQFETCIRIRHKQVFKSVRFHICEKLTESIKV